MFPQSNLRSSSIEGWNLRPQEVNLTGQQKNKKYSQFGLRFALILWSQTNTNHKIPARFKHQRRNQPLCDDYCGFLISAVYNPVVPKSSGQKKKRLGYRKLNLHLSFQTNRSSERFFGSKAIFVLMTELTSQAITTESFRSFAQNVLRLETKQFEAKTRRIYLLNEPTFSPKTRFVH